LALPGKGQNVGLVSFHAAEERLVGAGTRKDQSSAALPGGRRVLSSQPTECDDLRRYPATDRGNWQFASVFFPST